MLRPEKCISCNKVKSDCNCSNNSSTNNSSTNPSDNLKPCCPDNEITSIHMVENQVMVVLDDCTYYLADPEVLKFKVDDYVISGEVLKTDNEPTLLKLTRRFGEIIDIDVSLLDKDTIPTNGYLTQENIIKIILNDGSEVEIDISEILNRTPDTNTYITGSEFNNNVITLINNDGSTINIDISNLDLGITDTYPVSGEVDENKQLTLTNNDDSQVNIDLSMFSTTDDYVVDGRVNSEYKLELDRINGGKLIIDTSIFKATESPFVQNITMNQDDSNNDHYTFNFIRNDGSVIKIDIQDILDEMTNIVYEQVMSTGFRINTQNDDYTLTGDDFNGRTIVRANKNDNQNITIPKPPNENFIGKKITIRKTNGEAGTFINLISGSEVFILPEDATPLRRVGSSVDLLYVGNGVYDAYVELP